MINKQNAGCGYLLLRESGKSAINSTTMLPLSARVLHSYYDGSINFCMGRRNIV
jgi:hypothetical protein